jgi:hypothetical protein
MSLINKKIIVSKKKVIFDSYNDSNSDNIFGNIVNNFIYFIK